MSEKLTRCALFVSALISCLLCGRAPTSGRNRSLELDMEKILTAGATTEQIRSRETAEQIRSRATAEQVEVLT